MRRLRSTETCCVCCVAAGLLLAGCATNPLERAERDRQWLAAQVLPLAKKEIGLANAEAAELDGKTFVELQEYERMVVFVPYDWSEWEELPDGGKRWKTFKTGEVPEGAVAHHWTDRFALAQQYRYHYRLTDDPLIVRRGPSLDAPYEAVVPVAIEVEHCHRIAGRVQSIPEAPEGMKHWRRSRGGGGYFFGIGCNRRSVLPQIGAVGRPATEVDDALATEAVAALEHVDLQQANASLELCYVYSDGQWRAESPSLPDGLPRPQSLDWDMGLPEDHRQYIMRP